MATFAEQLQQLRKTQEEHPLVEHVRQWLDGEAERFARVELDDDDEMHLAPPEMGGWTVRKPENAPRSNVAEVFADPREELPGARRRDPAGNLGFSVHRHGRLTGHFVWPQMFNTEAVPQGWTPHEARKYLRNAGFLFCKEGRSTTFLPQTLARKTALGQPRHQLERQSSGGLAYKKPKLVERRPRKIRVLALRGFYESAA